MKDTDVQLMFEKFIELPEVRPGEGIVFNTVQLWIQSRNRAYVKYTDLLSVRTIQTNQKWLNDFKDFLHFKYNQSWTTLYRRGLEATLDPKKLKTLLIFLQDESISITERVRECLEGGAYKCPGIANNIVTALLHTFHPEIYGVWNSATEKALKEIGQKPTIFLDKGKTYNIMNQKLIGLAKQLNSDLTTIDCFMWFVVQETENHKAKY